MNTDNKPKEHVPVDPFTSGWGVETKPQPLARTPGDLLKRIGGKSA